MKKQPLPELPADVKAAIVEAQERLLEGLTGLSYDLELKNVTLNGRALESVTSLVKRYTRFDPAKAAIRCSKNHKSKYFGTPPEEILAGWERLRIAGKWVHRYAEEYCADSRNSNPFLERRKRWHNWDKSNSHRKTDQEKIATRNWTNDHNNKFVEVARETDIVNKALGYHGIFDALYIDSENMTFTLCDYKTSRDAHQWYGTMMRRPFHHTLKDNVVGRCTLQLNLYAMQLKNLGIDVKNLKLIWVKADGAYEEFTLPFCFDLVEEALIKWPEPRQKRKNKAA